jgi:protein-L-isoaspartate(D-aspartate) O-methyltransferase
MMDFTLARERMVRDQIESRGIRDQRVLQAMREVPRHRFVDDALAPSAYRDHALPIGFNQTISQPYMVGVMPQLLRPAPEHRILDIGTGSGYQAAVLSRIVHAVFCIERIPELTLRAQSVLRDLGYDNVILRTGDGTLGWSRFAPYDGIVVAAGCPPDAPPALLEQLKVGGRLVIPVGDRGRQRLLIAEKREEGVDVRHGTECTFVPLIGKEGWPGAPGQD